jgi:hypothetical protein
LRKTATPRRSAKRDPRLHRPVGGAEQSNPEILRPPVGRHA